MSQNQQELAGIFMTEAQPTVDECGNLDRPERMVPVNEAIRYRKRAQAAEEQVAELTAQLKQREETGQVEHAELEAALQEKRLMGKLIEAGTTDIEVALMLARQKLQERQGDETSVQPVIEELRTARPGLFGNQSYGSGFGVPTAGTRPQACGASASLGRLAERATRSGNRRDVQEYLRLRRSVRR